MSLACLLEAVRDELRDNLGIPDILCGIQSTGQPPPGIGTRLTYLAIHPISWTPYSSREFIHALGESYSIGVTLSKRIAYAPQDRNAQEIFLKSLVGFEAVARQVMINIHQNYDIMARANGFIESRSLTNLDKEGFIETLRWQRTDAVPSSHDASWFWDIDREGSVPLASESLEIVFSQAGRIQRQTLME